MKTSRLRLRHTLTLGCPPFPPRAAKNNLARSLKRASEGLLRDSGYLCRFLPELGACSL